MSRSSGLILLGVIVLIVPFLGVPESWIAFIEAICGLVLVGLGVALRTEGIRRIAPPPAIKTESEPSSPSAIS